MTSKVGSGGGDGAGDMTALDAALARADDGDAQAQAFYDAFLQAQLYVPTAEGPDSDPDAGLRLLVAEVEDERIVPVFDTHERFAEWAEADCPFAVVSGFSLVEALDPALSLALNVGLSGFKLFVPDELAWLRQQISQTVTGLGDFDPSLAGEFREVEPPAELMAALRPALQRHAMVAAAFLVAASEGERRWILVLDVGDAPDETFGALARDIGVDMRAVIGEGEAMDILAFNPLDEIGRELLRRSVAPVYASGPDAR